MKKLFLIPEMEVIHPEIEDIVTTSTCADDSIELPGDEI